MRKFLILPLVLIVFLTGCSGEDYSIKPSTSSYSNSYSSTPSISGEEITACAYSQIEIKSKLKSPSSAEDAPCSANTYKSLGAKKYQVTSYVDATNSFGASVRTNYQCAVTLTDSDEYYIKCNIL